MSQPQKKVLKKNPLEVAKVDLLLGKISNIVNKGTVGDTALPIVEESGLAFTIDDDQATVIRLLDPTIEHLTIPDRVNDVPVTSIGDKAFQGNTLLKSVRSGESLVTVGRRAFAGCSNLESVVFEEGLELIRSEAFRGSSSLAEVLLPSSLKQVNRFAFAECEALVEIELPQDLRILNRGTFQGATALESVGLPYELERIGTDAFRGCASLRSLYYYSMRGISDVMITDKDLKLESLPTKLSYIGANAFRDCVSLRRVEIPRNVVKIPSRAFSGCRRLRYVGLHNRIRSIGDQAFRSCVRLKSIRVPFGCNEIGNLAFSGKTTVVASKSSYASAYCQDTEQPWRAPLSSGAKLSSAMLPNPTGEEASSFYTRRQLTAAIERFEIRYPSYRRVKREDEELVAGSVPAARFEYDGTVYKGKSSRKDFARIMVVGDLMSRFRQQQVAAQSSDTPYDFSFEHVRDLFAQADFVCGNLESTVSTSSPFTLEMEHVDARPHLNVSPAFLSAIRRSGIDCVTNAQNHVYDSGTRGVFETLNAVNHNQLMHTGVFVSRVDPRFLVVDLGGIKIGVVAYLDSARQMMKKANFTKVGLDTMFPYFDEEKITEDIASARAAGAEFVIANCHWGREYTPEITERQREFAQRVADAGADYIVGAHSHCVQPCEILTSADERRVPCLWSAGNFISDINLKPPITRDTLIIDLLLHRGDDGNVYLADESYHPCRIMNLRVDDGDDRDYTVVPTSTDLGGTELNKSLAEAEHRIIEVVGPELKVAR